MSDLWVLLGGIATSEGAAAQYNIAHQGASIAHLYTATDNSADRMLK
ncbi:hypothetical protein [Sinomonas flava]